MQAMMANNPKLGRAYDMLSKSGGMTKESFYDQARAMGMSDNDIDKYVDTLRGVFDMV